MKPLQEFPSGESVAMGGGSPIVRNALFALLLFAVLGWGFSRWDARPIAFDDAFISYRYAENLVQGEGLVYNPGERVEGYTNFLWVMLAAAGIELGLHPFAVARAVGVGAYLIAIALCAFALKPGRRWQDWLWLSFLGALVLPRGLAESAGSGLETSFVGVSILAMGLANHVWRPTRVASRAAAASLPAVLLFTRLDAALAVAASGLIMLIDHRLQRGSWWSGCKSLAERFGPGALLFLAYLWWKLRYYGELLPNSYYAKAANLWRIESGLAYVSSFASDNPQVLALIALSALGAVSASSVALRSFARFGCVALVMQVAYTVKVGGDFMQYRFMWEYYPLLVAAAVAGVLTLARRSTIGAISAVVVVLATSGAEPTLDKRFYMQSLAESDRYVEIGRRVGKRLAEVLPDDVVIATTLAGTISYFSRLETVDQWGLNDRFIAHLSSTPAGWRRGRGHMKAAPLYYLRHRRVNLLIDHPVVQDCSRRAPHKLPTVLVRLGETHCLRAVYLTQTPELTRHFCSNPSAFIRPDAPCPTRFNDSVAELEASSGSRLQDVVLQPLESRP